MKIELEGYNIDNLLLTLHIKKIKLFNVQKASKNSVSFSCGLLNSISSGSGIGRLSSEQLLYLL